MKRLFDISASLLGLIICSPIFLVLSIIIVIDSPGGVFFRGERVGQHGKIFKIFKFRSMKPDCEGKGKWNVGDNDDRITKIGHFLRKSKLDGKVIIRQTLKNLEFARVSPVLSY